MRFVALYLPQYHPIPENDRWWGKGFTEWMNVTRASSLFRGHYQPQLPRDLGFYDLRVPEVMQEQSDLANAYGVDAFCFYHYWFNGYRLLERPVDAWLADGPDFPFCLCWANESWTRRWNGQDADVLMAQDYLTYDPVVHARALEPFLKDSRALKVHDRPVFLLYWPSAIPNLEEVVDRWRSTWMRAGLDVYLVAVHSYRNILTPEALRAAGFDAVMDFEPNDQLGVRPRNWRELWIRQHFQTLSRRIRLRKDWSSTGYWRYDYTAWVEKWTEIHRTRRDAGIIRWPCVFPSWDNTARRQNRWPTIIQNTEIGRFQGWLEAAQEDVRMYSRDEQVVFINAWNEWGEGCHLEPDRRVGHTFLEAVRASKVP